MPDGLQVVKVGDLRRGARRGARHRRPARRHPCRPAAEPARPSAQSSLKVARRACTSPGAMSSPRATRSSLSWSRWRSRQRADPSRVTATSSRTSARPGCSATARSAVGVVLGQLALGLRGHDDPLDGEGAPGHLRRARRSGRAGPRGRRPRAAPPARRRSARPATASWAAIPSARLRLAGEQVPGRHEGEQPHRLVPPGAGDVPLGVEGGEGERVGHGLGGVGHRTMVPDARAGGRGTLLAHGRHGDPRRRDEESSESLGVVRRARGPG